MAGKDSTHVNTFKNLGDNLKLVIHQVQDGESTKTSTMDFDSHRYWAHMGSVFQALSMEGTKLSLAFTKPPFPDAKECEGMVQSMERTVLELVSTFYSLPKDQGACLWKRLQRAVLDVMDSVLTLVTTLASLDPGGSERRQATGVVWEETNSFASLPKTNNAAVLLTLEQTMTLVNDALEETDDIAGSDGRIDDGLLDEEGEGEGQGDNTQSWSDKEREMVGPVKGLIKTASKLLGKTRQTCKTKGLCECGAQVSELDDINDCAERLSPAVDNLTTCLYVPVNHQNVRKNATTLSDIIATLLGILRKSHMTGMEDIQWLDFLDKANTHNLTTLTNLLDK